MNDGILYGPKIQEGCSLQSVCCHNHNCSLQSVCCHNHNCPLQSVCCHNHNCSLQSVCYHNHDLIGHRFSFSWQNDVIFWQAALTVTCQRYTNATCYWHVSAIQMLLATDMSALHKCYLLLTCHLNTVTTFWFISQQIRLCRCSSWGSGQHVAKSDTPLQCMIVLGQEGHWNYIGRRIIWEGILWQNSQIYRPVTLTRTRTDSSPEMSRLSLGPTQPLVQRALWFFPELMRP
jgi:hypothetical protein